MGAVLLCHLAHHFETTFKIQTFSFKYLVNDMVSYSYTRYWPGNTSPKEKSSLRELT
jgi:hypothetical protein